MSGVPFWALLLLCVTGAKTNNTVHELNSMKSTTNAPGRPTSISLLKISSTTAAENHSAYNQTKSTNSPNCTHLNSSSISEQTHTTQCRSTEITKNEDGGAQKWLLSVSFMAGVFSSSIIFSTFFFLIYLIQRPKQRKMKVQDEEQNENLKMVTKTDEQLHDEEEVDQKEQVLNEGPPLDESLEDSAAADKRTSGMDAAAKEVNYATIDYSLLKEREEAQGVESYKESEYAEIKQKEVRKEVQTEQQRVEEDKLDEEIQDLAGQEVV